LENNTEILGSKILAETHKKCLPLGKEYDMSMTIDNSILDMSKKRRFLSTKMKVAARAEGEYMYVII
jgi:hypothetical protein